MSECTHDCSSCGASCSSRQNVIEKEKLNDRSSVKKVIVEVLLCDESELFPETTFTGDLGADSLDVVDIVSCVEEEFGIKIPIISPVSTVGDVINLIP